MLALAKAMVGRWCSPWIVAGASAPTQRKPRATLRSGDSILTAYSAALECLIWVGFTAAHGLTAVSADYSLSAIGKEEMTI